MADPGQGPPLIFRKKIFLTTGPPTPPPYLKVSGSGTEPPLKQFQIPSKAG